MAIWGVSGSSAGGWGREVLVISCRQRIWLFEFQVSRFPRCQPHPQYAISRRSSGNPIPLSPSGSRTTAGSSPAVRPGSAEDVVRIQAWADQTLSPNPAAATPSTQASPAPLSAERQVKIAIGLEKLESQKLLNQAKRGELHSTAECQQRLARVFTEMRMSLIGFADSLPLDPDSKDIVRGGLIGLCKRFAGEANPPPVHAPASSEPRR